MPTATFHAQAWGSHPHDGVGAFTFWSLHTHTQTHTCVQAHTHPLPLPGSKAHWKKPASTWVSLRLPIRPICALLESGSASQLWPCSGYFLLSSGHGNEVLTCLWSSVSGLRALKLDSLLLHESIFWDLCKFLHGPHLIRGHRVSSCICSLITLFCPVGGKLRGKQTFLQKAT